MFPSNKGYILKSSSDKGVPQNLEDDPITVWRNLQQGWLTEIAISESAVA